MGKGYAEDVERLVEINSLPQLPQPLPQLDKL
ncbi:Uncharacterised protein [Acetobacterium wieringae]|nr:Uncharacterised protein [Acetobacterium wieringae]